MYIGRVGFQNWRNFKRTAAVLGRRVFVIGPNASGKSNFLDAFRFLREVAESGLSSAVNRRNGVSSIRCLAARKSPGVAIDVLLRRESGANAWRYRLEFNQDPSGTPLVKAEVVEDLARGAVVTSRPDAEDEADPRLLTQTALEQITANRDFREVAEFFSSISYQHVVPQAVRDPDGFAPGRVRDDPFGRDLLIRIWNTPKRTREAWLRRIGAVLRQAVPQLASLTIEMDQKQAQPHLVGRFEHWRAHGARHTEAQFSDGTLRLFGLMWSMFEGSGPLLLEEPELSLHVEVVRQVPALLVSLQAEIRSMRKGVAPRQVLISTHSDELLRNESIGGEEVLRIEPGPEGSTLEAPAEQELEMLRAGLTVADVLLPRSAPGHQQLVFDF
jgi:predicted ATPase